MAVKFRPCTRADAARLTEVAHASKRHWGYPESWIAEWRGDLNVTPERIELYDAHAAILDESVAGFFMLDFDDLRAEVEGFWVDPEFIGRGVGRAMFEHAVACARTRGATALDITSDPNAEPFYRRMGARTVGDVAAPVAGQPRRLPRLVFEIDQPRSR